MLQVGMIGLGTMGAPMARNLARTGLLHAVWNRTPNKAKALAEELRVKAPATPAELARQFAIDAPPSSAHPMLTLRPARMKTPARGGRLKELRKFYPQALRLRQARPASPRPNRDKVAGSGTAKG